MDDLHDRMEDLARRVDTAAAPDLEQVRDRRTRRRRTSGLVVGVALAVIVALLAVQMARPSSPTVPAASQEPSSETLTVWPDADTGAEPWRADEAQLIQRFAQTVLGWSNAYVLGEDGQNRFELRPEECPDAARCTPPLTVTTVEGEPGVWSIQAISQPDLEIEVGVADPAVALTGGSRIRFDLNLADDRAGHIGMVASNGCREASAYDVGLDAGTHFLELPAVTPDDPACDDMGAGYLFAYAMDDTTVPTGNPLLEAAAIEYPWLTVVPIYLQMEEPDATASAAPGGDPANTAEIYCDPAGGLSKTSVVAARADGVHVTMTNPGPANIVFHLGSESFEVPPGSREVTLSSPPGRVRLRCTVDQERVVWGDLSVVDPDGWYGPVTELTACSETVGSMGSYGGPTPVKDQNDLAFSAYEAVFPAAEFAGQMVLQGYPEDPNRRVYAAVLDGETYARVILAPIEEGWGVAGTLACA